LSAGNYSVLVTDANGCTATNTINITEPSVLTSSVQQTGIIKCFGNSGTVTATASGGTTNYSYLWSPGGQTTAGVTLAAGFYSVTITDAGGCTNVDTITLNQPAQLIVPSTQTNPSCYGLSDGTASVNPSGGTPGYTYMWVPGPGNSSSVSGLAQGTYYAVVTDANQCTQTATVVITQPSALTASITSTNATCGNTDGTATASPNGGTAVYTYLWNPSSSASATANALAAGLYSVTITDAHGCTTIDTITVHQDGPPHAVVNGDTVICLGDYSTVNGSGGLQYSWSNGATTSSISVNPATATTYTLTAINGNCTDQTTITVNVNPLPTASAGTDTTIMQFQSATLNGSGGIGFQWSPSSDLSCSNCQHPVATPMTTTTYTLTVTDANGCSSTSVVTVNVTPIECNDPYLPNAFSPNSDGENDVLKLYNKVPQCVKDLHLVIFNRWGEKVFETTDTGFEWNGVYNRGILANSSEAGTEVFVYRMDATIYPDKKIKKTGNISLVR